MEVTVTLPNALAQEAEAQGLLAADVMEQLVRSELERRRRAKLFATANRLANDEPPLTAAELEAEIAAARVERRTSDARSR